MSFSDRVREKQSISPRNSRAETGQSRWVQGAAGEREMGWERYRRSIASEWGRTSQSLSTLFSFPFSPLVEARFEEESGRGRPVRPVRPMKARRNEGKRKSRASGREEERERKKKLSLLATTFTENYNTLPPPRLLSSPSSPPPLPKLPASLPPFLRFFEPHTHEQVS